MKILQIFSRYQHFGGEEAFAASFTKALQDQHHIIDLYGSTSSMIGTSFAQRLFMPARAWHNTKVESQLRTLQSLHHFDLWVVQNALPGLSPSVYQTAFKLKVPLVHYLHNYRMACTNGFFLNHGQPCERCLGGNFWPAFQTACWRDSHLISGMMGLILRRVRSIGTFQNVAVWVALSEAQRAKHVQMGVPAKRIHVIPHFYEPKESPPPPCPNGDILFLGRLSPEKGVDVLLRAWQLIRPCGRKLIIAGSGQEESRLKALATQLGLLSVEFPGFVLPQDQGALWARTSFSVMPSIWNEPFPLAFLEAWSNQRAVISSSLGAMAEVVDDGIDGLLCAPFSASSLATKIQYLIDHPDQIAPMGAAGFAKLQTHFTRTIWLARINKAFSSALL
jgi:glycosyltransferase involved in cell wall biosynthesis